MHLWYALVPDKRKAGRHLRARRCERGGQSNRGGRPGRAALVHRRKNNCTDENDLRNLEKGSLRSLGKKNLAQLHTYFRDDALVRVWLEFSGTPSEEFVDSAEDSAAGNGRHFALLILHTIPGYRGFLTAEHHPGFGVARAPAEGAGGPEKSDQWTLEGGGQVHGRSVHPEEQPAP